MAEITDTKIFTKNKYLILKTFNIPSCMIDLSCQKHVEINTSESIDKSLMINGKFIKLDVMESTLNTLTINLNDLSYNVYNSNINSNINSNNNLTNTLNDLTSNFNDLSSNFIYLSSNYNDLGSNFNNLSSNFNDLSTNFIYLNTNFNELSSNFNDLSTNFIYLNSNFNELSSNFIDLSSNFNDLSSNLITNYNLIVENSNATLNNLTLNGELKGISTLVIDPSPIGNEGIVRIKGGLIVDGSTTIINSTIVDICDKTILLASNAKYIDDTDGAGLEISGNKNILYNSSKDAFVTNISFEATNLKAIGNIEAVNIKSYYQTVNSDNSGVGDKGDKGSNMKVVNYYTESGCPSDKDEWYLYDTWKTTGANTINTNTNIFSPESYGFKALVVGTYKITVNMAFQTNKTNQNIVIRLAKNGLNNDVLDSDQENPGPMAGTNLINGWGDGDYIGKINSFGSASLTHIMTLAVNDEISLYTFNIGQIHTPPNCYTRDGYSQFLVEYLGN